MTGPDNTATEVFTCPTCGARSHNTNDVREGYCGACHDYTGRRAGLTIRPAL